MNSTFSNNVRVLYLSRNVKKPKQLQNFLKSETNVVLIVLDGVLLKSAHILLPFLTVAQLESGTRKNISCSVTVCNKNVSRQCILTAQIEQVQRQMQVMYGEQLS